jgi:hypothetical protein
VLLVTKAVGDLLGVRGIAEEAIRFNGYPFLEKDDHVYDAPGRYLLLLVQIGAADRMLQYHGLCGGISIPFGPQV